LPPSCGQPAVGKEHLEVGRLERRENNNKEEKEKEENGTSRSRAGELDEEH